MKLKVMFRNARTSAILLGIVLSQGCTRPVASETNAVTKAPPDSGTFERGQLLGAFATCALETYRTFDDATAKLATAITASKTTPSDATRAAARETWIAAIDAWQQAEAMQVGPLASATSAGGQSMRDNIYAWPLFGRCAVDQILVGKTYESADFLVGALVNTRGLAVVEYLAFQSDTQNGCAPTATINASGSWAALSDDELALRRASFADVLMADVRTRSRALVEAWAPAKGNFVASLATGGRGSTIYKTDQAALNAVSDALFYLDFVTKDRKLAAPLGIDATACASAPCTELVESPFAKRSKQHIRNNLVAFRKLFEGCGKDYAGLGFDDLLVAVGAGSLASDMKADVAAAIAAVDAFPYASIDEGLAKDPAAVRKVHDAIKAITDALKNEFKSVLAFEIPATAAGDND